MRRTLPTGTRFFLTSLLGIALLGAGCSDDPVYPPDVPDLNHPDDRIVGEGGSGPEFYIPNPGTNKPLVLPRQLIKEPGNIPSGLFVNNDDVYWFDYEQTGCCGDRFSLFSTTFAGGKATRVASFDYVPSTPVTDDRGAYWFDSFGNDIYFLAYGDDQVQHVVTAGVQVAAIGIGTGHLFFGGIDGAIYKVEKGGGEIFLVSEGANELPAHISVYDQQVYWSTVGTDRINGHVFAYFVEKDIVEEIVADYDLSRGFVVDDNNLYWIDGQRRSVMSADRFTGDTTVLVPRQYSGSSLVIDRGNIFFSTQAPGMLQRVDKTGGATDVVAREQDEPGSMVLDGSNLLWINELDATIMILNLP